MFHVITKFFKNNMLILDAQIPKEYRKAKTWMEDHNNIKAIPKCKSYK